MQVSSFILLLVSFNENQQQAAVYYDRAAVSKGTLVGETQFGTLTPIVKNDLNRLYVFQGGPFSSF